MSSPNQDHESKTTNKRRLDLDILCRNRSVSSQNLLEQAGSTNDFRSEYRCISSLGIHSIRLRLQNITSLLLAS